MNLWRLVCGCLNTKSIKSICILSIFCITWMPWTYDKHQWFFWLGYYGNFLSIVAFVVLISRAPLFNRALVFTSKTFRKKKISNRQWLALSVLIAFSLAAIGSDYFFSRIPFAEDSYAQYLQAKIFASGQWYGSSHPLPRFFDMTFFVNDGKVYSQYPPGHSLILTLGFLVGAPWLVNPMLGAMSIVAVYFLTREISTRAAARIATILTLSSINFILLASEYMNHMTALLCTLCFALFYIRSHRSGQFFDALMAGNALGYLIITRPQVAVPLAVPFVLHWVITKFRSSPALFWRNGIATTISFSIWAAFFCYYNAQTTGNPLVTGYEKVGEWGVMPRLNLDLGQLYYDLNRVIIQLQAMHIHMFSWCTSSLIFVWLLFQLRLARSYCGLLIAAALSIALSLIATPYWGGAFNARYLFEASGFCLVLSAVCIVRLPVWAKHVFGLTLPISHARITLLLVVALLFLLAIPYRIADSVKYYSGNDYPAKNPGFYHALLEIKKPALVFVGSEFKHWMPASLFNLPSYDSPIIAAVNRGDENQQLIDMYPNRFIYYAKNRKSISLSRSPLDSNTDTDSK